MVNTFVLFILLLSGASAQANTDGKECARLLSRFETPLNKLESLLQSETSPALLVDKIMAVNGRTFLFDLEAEARIYMNADKKKMKAVLKTFKKLEDALGQYDFWLELEKKLIKVAADARILQKQTAKTLTEKNKLIRFLKANDWINSSARPAAQKLHFVGLRAKIYKADLPNANKDRQYVLAVLQDYIKSLHKAVKDGEYDPNEVESGIHELRRDLRWISIYIKNNEDMVLLDKTSVPIEQYRPLIKSMKDNPYVQLKKPTHENPIVVPFSLFAALVDIIGRLGQVKDFGLFWGTIEHEIADWRLRVDKNQLKEKLQAEYAGLEPAATAAAILEELRETKLLKEFAGFLKDQI